jgi:hypothetical protein
MIRHHATCALAGRTRRRSYVSRPTRIDPTMPATRSLRMAVVEHLKYQLTGLAEGQYTLSRSIDLAKDLIETAWNELTPQDIGELDSWLKTQVRATRAKYTSDGVSSAVSLIRYVRQAAPVKAQFGARLTLCGGDHAMLSNGRLPATQAV